MTPETTPFASLFVPRYSKRMRTKSQRQEWFRKKAADRPEGVCSRYPDCVLLTDGAHKLCPHHLASSLASKETRKRVPKEAGQCYAWECKNPARPGLTRCDRCAAREARWASTPTCLQRRAERRREVREEVMAAYGGVCVCCGESRLVFLTIDHEARYAGVGPKTGNPLYMWLKAQGFPEGFRVLCHNCNFAMGLFGYCPHGDLRQPLPERPIQERTRQLQVVQKARNLKNKLAAFHAYGGVSCQCCQEEHHECLSIDHMDNRGGDHRKALAGKPIYQWLAEEGYPEGFQVLCMNCNFAKRFHLVCPHKSDPLGG